VETDNDLMKVGLAAETPTHSSPNNLSSSVTIGLPRIAEEKDSPKDDHSGESQPGSLDSLKGKGIFVSMQQQVSSEVEQHGSINKPEEATSFDNGANPSNATKGKEKSLSKPEDKTRVVANKQSCEVPQPQQKSAVPAASKESSKKSKDFPIGWLKSSKSDKKSP
jgi:hypothetical protein